ncbi:MAG: tetratricopeptide repeat protein [candidate division Zixibacteria bacterium]|nr:tetratricopeptide repeat protein [candidate division Zixibacteria bacterium]
MKQTGIESRFEILERLGRGGTAEVLRARLRDTGREIALKCPLPDPDHAVDFARLAAREIDLIGGLRFPGLVRILNRPDDPQDQLLLELCAGKTLDQIDARNNLPFALNLLSAVALDLEYLRQRGIVHGDLKPQNIFLPNDLSRCESNDLFYAKLSDFSLGRKITEPESSRAGLGTVGYMAPETIADGHADHRSDLFAFGVIAYQLLTGRHPFIDGESDPVRINARVREENPASVRLSNDRVPERLANLVSALLDKDPQRRPNSPLAVCRELQLCGGSYPYKRAILPRHLLAGRHTYDQALAVIQPLSPEHRKRLDVITDRDLTKLHVTLAISHRLGRLELTENGFSCTSDIYWPSRLRRATLAKFAPLKLSEKKDAIRQSVRLSPAGDSLSTLLLPLLRPATICRLARAEAINADKTDQMLAATRLYLAAGDLESADRCAYQAASILRANHQAPEAILCINAVLDLAFMTERLKEVRPLLMLKGDIQKETGLVEDALASYLRIVELYNGQPVDKLLAETYKDLGDLYKMKQDSKAGLDALKRALDIYREMGEELEMSRTYNNIGNSHFYAGDIANTLRHYRAALRIQRRLKATTETASTLSNLGSVYCMQGNLSRGILLLQKSLDLKKELGDVGEIARTLNNLGYVLYLKGDFDRAMTTLWESLEINQRIGSKREILFNLENMTAVMQGAGQLPTSLQYLEQGINLSKELNDLPHQLVFSHSLAVTSLRLGRPVECRRNLDDVFALMRQVEDPQIAVQARLTLAQLRLLVGDLRSASQAIQEAEQVARETTIKPFLLQAMVSRLRVDGSPESFEQVIALARELGQVDEINTARFNLIEYLLEGGQIEVARSHRAAIEEVSGSLKRSIDRPRMLNINAELLIDALRVDEAKAIVNSNRQEARQFGLLPEYAHTLVLSGQIQSSRGELENAFADYRQALQILKTISDSLESDQDKAAFQTKRVVKFLVSEIRRLGTTLGQKQRAGFSPALP